MLRTGLIVEVHEAEDAVGSWRSQLDPQADLGVPAHITVLFPFAAPDDLDATTTAALRQLFTGVPWFEFQLTHTAWFGDQVLWLAPHPVEPFIALNALVSHAFPAYPHFGGQFAEFIPHLTIGDHGTVEEFRAAERDVETHLPISAAARAVTLMVEQHDNRWERFASFPLNQRRQ